MLGLDPQNSTVKRIYEHWESKSENRRPYLGASAIGHECTRRLWLSFRWTFQEKFEGRILRLFNRGHREEPVFEEEMRAIGCQLEGTQHEEVDHKGHFKMHCDGAILGLVEAPKTWHVADFKTMSDKSFKKFQKCETDDDFAEEYPHYHGQLHVEMEMMGLDRAVLIAVNKNNDELGMLRLKKSEAGAYYLNRALEIIEAEAPEPLNRKPTDFRCRFCPANEVCHGKKAPEINCRNCCYSTPVEDGKWACAKHDGEIIDKEFIPLGCDSHIWVPGILPMEMGDFGPGWIAYNNGLVNYSAGCEVPEEIIENSQAVATSLEIVKHFDGLRDGNFESILSERTSFPEVTTDGEFTDCEPEPDERKQMLLDLIEEGDENAKADFQKEYGK